MPLGLGLSEGLGRTFGAQYCLVVPAGNVDADDVNGGATDRCANACTKGASNAHTSEPCSNSRGEACKEKGKPPFPMLHHEV